MLAFNLVFILAYYLVDYCIYKYTSIYTSKFIVLLHNTLLNIIFDMKCDIKFNI